MSVTSPSTAVRYETWLSWPVYWSAIWIGVFSAIATGLILGLLGVAAGAHLVIPGYRLLKWSEFGFGALIFSVFGAFFSFVLGGWVTGKVAGIRHSEPGALHGALVWVFAVPVMLVLAALGAASFFGSWYGGLAGAPGWVVPPQGPVDPDAVIAARNAAMGAVAGLLLGLAGSVLGGWLSSGEPMSWTYDRKRVAEARTGSSTRIA